MDEFKLLRPEEVISRWSELRETLLPAVASSNGEMVIDDVLRLVIAGRMFVFASSRFALTVELRVHPGRTTLFVGFGAGKAPDREYVAAVLTEFGKQAGADNVQTLCKNPAMVRYFRRWLHLEPTYILLEKKL